MLESESERGRSRLQTNRDLIQQKTGPRHFLPWTPGSAMSKRQCVWLAIEECLRASGILQRPTTLTMNRSRGHQCVLVEVRSGGKIHCGCDATWGVPGQPHGAARTRAKEKEKIADAETQQGEEGRVFMACLCLRVLGGGDACLSRPDLRPGKHGRQKRTQQQHQRQ